MRHELKIWPSYFQEVWDGWKTFELRERRNRLFRVGDELLLKEFDEIGRKYTGRECLVKVNNLLSGDSIHGQRFGLQPGFVCMAISRLPTEGEDEKMEQSDKQKNENAGPKEAEVRPPVTADQESWVMDRIDAAIRMALALKAESKVGADWMAYEGGLEGVVRGAAIEVIRLLGREPAWINIKPMYRRRVSGRIRGSVTTPCEETAGATENEAP